MMVDSLLKVSSTNNSSYLQSIRGGSVYSYPKSSCTVKPDCTDSKPCNGLPLLTEQELMEVLERISLKLESTDIAAEYSVHERTNTIMVKLKDCNTNEIIKEIPPEKLLDMLGSLWDLVGLLVDDKI